MANPIYDVAVVVGSLRKESFSCKMALAIADLAPPSLKLEIAEIGAVTHFNQDEEANPPAANAAFKARIQKADAVLFVTPEYNRSVPGVLKNAIGLYNIDMIMSVTFLLVVFASCVNGVLLAIDRRLHFRV